MIDKGAKKEEVNLNSPGRKFLNGPKSFINHEKLAINLAKNVTKQKEKPHW